MTMQTLSLPCTLAYHKEGVSLFEADAIAEIEYEINEDGNLDDWRVLSFEFQELDYSGDKPVVTKRTTVTAEHDGPLFGIFKEGFNDVGVLEKIHAHATATRHDAKIAAAEARAEAMRDARWDDQ